VVKPAKVPPKKAKPKPSPEVKATPAPLVQPKKAGLRGVRTLGTQIPRPKPVPSKPVLPKTEAEPQRTGRDDPMTVAIARLFLGGLIDVAELQKHRTELMLDDAQFNALLAKGST
jgi:hypothetical protein